MFSRILRAGDNLLWWNEFNHSISTSYESTTYTGRINNPGLYTSYCIEFDVANLPLNMIAICEEQQHQTVQQNKKVETLDEMGRVQTAFEYLRKMVRAFVEDVEGRKSEEGDMLLSNVYRWVMTKRNSLYDPLLHRLVRELTKNLFYTLMLKIKEMGFKIIYANFERFVISTEKYTFQEARNRTNYMLSKCLHDDKKKYRFIILKPVKIWSTLLWRDQYNYGGWIE